MNRTDFQHSKALLYKRIIVKILYEQKVRKIATFRKTVQ
jgi:hypothetical protein